MNLLMVENAVRKRLASLWGVQPYRLEVEVISPEAFKILVDGVAPTQAQLRLLEEDIQKTTQAARLRMN